MAIVAALGEARESLRDHFDDLRFPVRGFADSDPLTLEGGRKLMGLIAAESGAREEAGAARTQP